MLLQRRTTYAATKVPSNAIPIVANSDGGGGSSPAGVALLLVLFDAMVQPLQSPCVRRMKRTSDFLGRDFRTVFISRPPHPTPGFLSPTTITQLTKTNIQQQHTSRATNA